VIAHDLARIDPESACGPIDPVFSEAPRPKLKLRVLASGRPEGGCALVLGPPSGAPQLAQIVGQHRLLRYDISMRLTLALLVALIPAGALAQSVPIQMTQDTFACRDISDTVRLGLRQLDEDKAGFLAFYEAKQAAGACQALRSGTVAELGEVRDEQGLHLACIKEPNEGACYWALNPRFGAAPY
jgi:hypothetical protein